MFITLEGIDGSGKTSIASMLKEKFEKSGKNVYLTEEPTQIIFDVKSIMEKELDIYTRIFIFMADRVEHIKIIKEKLSSGYVVICDRYVDSTFAYQGAVLKNFLNGYENAYQYMNNIYRPFSLEPDIIIYLDVDPKIGLGRIKSRKREYFEKIEYLREVRNFYIHLSKIRNYIYIDSNSSLEDAWKQLTQKLINLNIP
ncbi:MAG: dTMP kinase [Thermoplasmata archaeon]|jgi:dTMP kinase|nr:dTMP kinase [Thermoplasmata archaeon]MVT13439.1 dTMP kinase [Euryarchaeota archaeon]MVT15069.1 dTMP kinase [Euryarchaeota archaeon]